MPLLDLDRFQATPLSSEPFKYMIVPGFLSAATAAEVARDFPVIDHAGLLPVEATKPGPLFHSLVAELTGPAVAAAVSEKFGVDIAGRPTMVTVRGRCQERDGRIHTDSVAKLITALIYFNEAWEAEGGRLRLLRSATDLNDVIAEVPPSLGTLVMFQRSDNSYHGHERFVGVRRSVMINWMTNSFTAQRELMRHRLSAQAKKILHYA